MTIEHFKKAEKFIPVKYQVAEWEFPTDYSKLQNELNKRTDEILYDWFSVLQEEPTLFGTEPPEWLLKTIPHQRRKCHDLLDAIFERIKYSKNQNVVFALEIYHGYVCVPSEGKNDKTEIENISPHPDELKAQILKGQVNFTLDMFGDIEKRYPKRKRECRHYVIKRVNKWAKARKDCLSSETWTSHGLQNKDFPGTLAGQVDFCLYVFDCIGEDFTKEEYRHYIIDTVSEWANEV